MNERAWSSFLRRRSGGGFGGGWGGYERVRFFWSLIFPGDFGMGGGLREVEEIGGRSKGGR